MSKKESFLSTVDEGFRFSENASLDGEKGDSSSSASSASLSTPLRMSAEGETTLALARITSSKVKGVSSFPVKEDPKLRGGEAGDVFERIESVDLTGDSGPDLTGEAADHVDLAGHAIFDVSLGTNLHRPRSCHSSELSSHSRPDS